MKFLIASKNKKKLNEMQRILSPLGIEVVSESDSGYTFPEVEENGTTFAENAKIKALSAMKTTGLPAVADDSGLCIDALNGAPGIYSARFSGDHNDDANNQKVFDLLKDTPDDKRTARFVCSICCVFPNGDEIVANGVCEGKIGYTLIGENGFGYDPLFMVGDKSFAQLSNEEKDKISHRGNAMREFTQKLKEHLKGQENDK